jgi:DNA-binding response OmpR family regulator
LHIADAVAYRRHSVQRAQAIALSDLMKQAGRSAGATGWLVKPFDPAKLLDVIKKVIR